jgi:hypothetical protein
VELAETDVNKQKEAEALVVQRSSQLQFLYTHYILMEICAERFTQFGGTKAGLKELLQSREGDIPTERAERIWNVTAEKFQQLEGALRIAGDAQL